MTEFEKWYTKEATNDNYLSPTVAIMIKEIHKTVWLAAMRVAYDFTLRCDRRPEDAILQEIEGLTKREDGE